jgi:GDPmannose 4,6-dehydratase
MWMMLQQEQPDDYVLATGRTHSVRHFVNAAGDALGFALEWMAKARMPAASISEPARRLLS